MGRRRMLRIIQNSSAAGAKSYYSSADYYNEGQELVGVWRGEGAKRLGLEGTVGRRDWDALCDNRDPRSGETLTARQKSNRRVGYDHDPSVARKRGEPVGGAGKQTALDNDVISAAGFDMDDGHAGSFSMMASTVSS